MCVPVECKTVVVEHFYRVAKAPLVVTSVRLRNVDLLLITNEAAANVKVGAVHDNTVRFHASIATKGNAALSIAEDVIKVALGQVRCTVAIPVKVGVDAARSPSVWISIVNR